MLPFLQQDCCSVAGSRGWWEGGIFFLVQRPYRFGRVAEHGRQVFRLFAMRSTRTEKERAQIDKSSTRSSSPFPYEIYIYNNKISAALSWIYWPPAARDRRRQVAFQRAATHKILYILCARHCTVLLSL